MFGNRPPKHEEEIKRVREEFYKEMDRIEALVLDAKVRGRDWNDADRQSSRNSMDPDRDNRSNNP